MNTIKLFSDIDTRTTDIFRRADDTQPLYVALDSSVVVFTRLSRFTT
jgi:hypothetical protein